MNICKWDKYWEQFGSKSNIIMSTDKLVHMETGIFMTWKTENNQTSIRE